VRPAGPGRILLAVLLLCGACSPSGEPAGGTAGRPDSSSQAPGPNLVLISLDTCRADRLTCYGGQEGVTPNLDALASEGALFTNCLAQSTATAPSHRSLLTGQYVQRHGLTYNGVAIRPPYTLASILQAAGWRTAAFTGGGYLHPAYGFDVGFDVFEYGDGPRKKLKPTFAEVLPRAEAWLEKNGGKPFFLFVHAYDPHCPYVPPEPFRDRFAGWYRGFLDPEGRCGRDDYEPMIAQGKMGPDERRFLSDLYDGGVASADALLGVFLDKLRGMGLLDHSIVVFTSDHGESLAEHGFVGHGKIWEEEIHVPLIVRFPGGKWAGRYDAPVQSVDLLPTLCAAMHVQVPEGVQGMDLLPLLRGDPAAVPAERMRLCKVRRKEAVRFDGRWKITFLAPKDAGEAPEQPHVYDMRADPGEDHDLYGTSGGRAAFDRLYARYQAWRAASREEDQRLKALPETPETDAHQRAVLEELGYLGGDESGGD